MQTQHIFAYPPCYLIGARASGKTTMGRMLAQSLSVALCPTSDSASRWCCLDMDDILVRALGESIADYVARMGWPAFRQWESQALRAATAPATVIATGGGCIVDSANGLFMREQGCVLYLRAPAEVLAARLKVQPLAAQRPSLTGADICTEVAEVLAVRDPLYRAAAQAVVDSTQSVDRVLADMLRAYSAYLLHRAQALA